MILVTTKTRLLKYLENKGISKSEFYSFTDIKRGLLDSDKLSAAVPDTTLAKIIAKYPDLNIIWLLTGTGTMLLPAAPIVQGDLIGYLKEKDKKIEELLLENARIKTALEMQAVQPDAILLSLARIEAKIDKRGESAATAGAVVG